MNDDAAIELAVLLAERFEGFYSRPYLCPAGVPTIGYGFTFYEDGSPVRLTDPPMDRERARRFLRSLVARKYLRAAQAYCPALTGGQLGAIADFAFNLGSNALKNSTLRRKINEGSFEEVPDQLRRWVRAGAACCAGSCFDVRRKSQVSFKHHPQETSMASKKVNNLAGFKGQFDRNVVIPNKIQAALESLAKEGPEAWEYEGDFIKRAQISTTDIGPFREQFAKHFVEAREPGKGVKRCWFGDAKVAAKALA